MHKRVLPIFTLWIGVMLSLPAETDFGYHLDLSTRNPVLKEAVILTLDLKQTDTHEVIRFSFEPPKSEKWETLLLRSEELKEEKGLNHIRYRYALFPLKTGKLHIPLSFTIKRATPEALKTSVTGSSDNAIFLQTEDTTVTIPSAILDVRPLPPGTMLVGDYSLDFSIDKNQTTPEQQINLLFTLKGRGYRPEIPHILPKISDVTVFSEKSEFNDQLFHKVTYRYALLADHNFTVPAIKLPAYDPLTKRNYLLQTPAIPITFVPPEHHDSPLSREDSSLFWQKYRKILQGLLLFCAGFFTAVLLSKLSGKPRISKGSRNFLKAVEGVKSPKELLPLLLAKEKKEYLPLIERIEQHLYGNQKIPLTRIKKEIVSGEKQRQSEKTDLGI
ncbi:MAG: hypothetical protein B6D59_02720 [Campylobacteraceae bacterium 4484_4]|nr:MAG: hypothetical protein B6D59_02720 [Campylobacteraceae bacterium 4484_4]